MRESKFKRFKKDCYLRQSNKFSESMIEEDNLSKYDDLLTNSRLSTEFRNVISNFLIPYNISILKYTLNKEFFEDKTPSYVRLDRSHYAPSLRNLKEKQMFAFGYPQWFYVAFPDVAYWALGSGNLRVKGLISNLAEEELSQNDLIKSSILQKLILVYKAEVNDIFECEIYTD